MRGVNQNFFLTLILLLLAMPALTMSALAADDDDSLQNNQTMKVIDRGIIKQVLKSDMVMLDNNKRYRFENILVPPFEDPPAIEELKRTFVDKPVIVYSYQDVTEDQETTGVVPYAHIVTKTGVWLQQDLIAKGLAWALSTDTSPQTVGVLKQTEEKARVNNMGFWKEPAYAIKSPENVKDFVNSYQLVEGRISDVTVKQVSGNLVFSFGKGKKRDFAVSFPNDDNFGSLLDDPVTGEKNKIGMSQWKGRTVRVRGWVKDEGNGPVMMLTRKEQLDIVVIKE